MSTPNDNSQNQTDETRDQSYAAGASGKELIDELTRVGQKFIEVVEVAWNSDQRKKVEEDLRNGLVSVASTLEDGFKRVSSTKEAQDAVNAAEEMAEKVRTSKIGVELSAALAQGLRSLSEQMDKLSEEMKQKSNSSPATTNSDNKSQEIPIARDEQA
jgi:hypothetical protein